MAASWEWIKAVKIKHSDTDYITGIDEAIQDMLDNPNGDAEVAIRNAKDKLQDEKAAADMMRQIQDSLPQIVWKTVMGNEPRDGIEFVGHLMAEAINRNWDELSPYMFKFFRKPKEAWTAGALKKILEEHLSEQHRRSKILELL